MPIVVPEDETFMMGDNRDHQMIQDFGELFHYKYIVGKPWFYLFFMDEKKKLDGIEF